ncbi:MAG: electron transfer flavoprotein beta subunit/FixA family protein [Acidimicrobiales bacterium]
MNILVCIKRVPDPGARINVTDDGLAIDDTHLGFTTSPHEQCAVEEAVQIVEREGGSVTVLTVGPPQAEEQLRYAASVGADHIVLVPTDGSAWDPQRTAVAIAGAIGARETDGATFDLILFGNESADSGGFQVGIRVANHLGRPIVSGISAIGTDDPETIVAHRGVEHGFEVYNLPRPAALGVKEGINLPRYPTMRGRLASRKAVVTIQEVQAPEGGQAMVRLYGPPETASTTEILGTDTSAATAVVDLLDEIGLL